MIRKKNFQFSCPQLKT